MDRHDDEKTGIDSLEDATGMEDSNAQPAMQTNPDEAPSGDEKTAIEGAAGVGATNRAWGGLPTDIEGGAGTDVPAEGEDELEPGVPPDQREDSSDPRGY